MDASKCRAGPRDVVAGGGGGGGALKAEVLNQAAKTARGEYERGDFFKIYVSEDAFQAILKPIIPYSITSILSKVRHTLKHLVLCY